MQQPNGHPVARKRPVKVHVSLTPEELVQLDRASEREGVSRSAAVRRMIFGIQAPIDCTAKAIR